MSSESGVNENSKLRTKNSEPRKRAEKRLKSKMPELGKMSDIDIKKQVHKLQVHQTELEMQNEELRRAQVALEESRQKYADLYDFAPVGYLVIDKKGLIIEANLTVAKQLGMERNLLVDSYFYNYINREDKDTLYLHLSKVFENKTPQNCEVRLKGAEEVEFYAQLNSVLMEDSGTHVSCKTSVTDLTMRKRTEESLEESEERFRILFESQIDTVVLLDKEFRHVAVNNPRIGKTSEELIGKTIYETLPPDLLEQMVPQLQCVFKTGKPLKVETSFMGPDERLIWLDTIIFPYYLRGEVRGIISQSRDITERKRLEEELQNSEELFRQMAENIRAVFWLCTADRREILYVNPAVEEIWGCSCKSVYENPRSFMESIHPEDQGKVVEAIEQQNQQGFEEEEYKEEYRIVRPDRSIRWIWSHYFPIRNDKGEVYRVAGIARDITERKTAEEALLQKTAALDCKNMELNKLAMEMTNIEERERKRFAEMLHEGIGQNLVAAKLLCANFLKQYVPDGKQRQEKTTQILSMLDEAIQSTRSMIADIYPAVLDNQDLFGAIEWYSKTLLNPEKITLSSNIDKTAEKITDDLKRNIFRIIRECFQNIVKHASASRVELACKRNKGSWRLTVKDNGVGFVYQDIKAKSKQGIGLMLMQELVISLNGSFMIQSQVGKGTEVLIELPEKIGQK